MLMRSGTEAISQMYDSSKPLKHPNSSIRCFQICVIRVILWIVFAQSFGGVFPVAIEELVYDWNTIEPVFPAPNRHIGFDDETLRDGLQSPSVSEPPVDEKIQLLHLMNALGIDTADIGLPGAGGTHAAGVEQLAREISEQKLKIRPNCAARTHRNDIVPIIEISHRVGIPIEACSLIACSQVRFFAEDWTLDRLLK